MFAPALKVHENCTGNRLVVAKGGRGGGKDWEFRISRCKLVYREQIHNKVLL